MITFYEELNEEEQMEMTACIQVLLKQSFLLEMKYDRKLEKLMFNPLFRTANKYLDFLQAYFRVAGIQLQESSHMGVLYIEGQSTIGEKISQLATIYILVLKILYDEKMESASNSIQVVTSLSELNEKAASYGVLKNKPSTTEIRKALALLKRYQIVEPLGILDDFEMSLKLLIYPSIHLVLRGEIVRALIEDLQIDGIEGVKQEEMGQEEMDYE